MMDQLPSTGTESQPIMLRNKQHRDMPMSREQLRVNVVAPVFAARHPGEEKNITIQGMNSPSPCRNLAACEMPV